MARKGPDSGPPQPDECAELVQAAAGGDKVAMERLLTRAQGVARRYSLAVCGYADDAEDAMQEALIKAYRHAGQIHDPGAFRPWLYRTVRNACLVGRRKKVHEPRQLDSLDAPVSGSESSQKYDPPDSGSSPEQLAVKAQRNRALWKALRALPAPYRAVVFLRELEGLSTREVATVLEISEDSVKTRLHRARARIKTMLDT